MADAYSYGVSETFVIRNVFLPVKILFIRKLICFQENKNVCYQIQKHFKLPSVFFFGNFISLSAYTFSAQKLRLR